MKKISEGHFAGRIDDFFEQKRSLGYDYKDYYYKLGLFAVFAAENYPTETTLTRELALAWCAQKDNESKATQNKKILALRQFAKYLLSIGETAYVIPSSFIHKGLQRPIRILSIDEIAALWHALDEMKPSQPNSVRHLVFPVIFRTIYCCGLRPSEALKLRIEDVNLKHGILDIKESKGHKSRIVVMPEDLTGYCRNYERLIRKRLPNRTAFFPNTLGAQFCYQSLWKEFKNVWSAAKISDKQPRIYDFRHSFATHRLYLWMKEGKDIDAMLPYLSAYMGHFSPSDTYYYIHFVPGLLRTLSGQDFSDCQHLLPEVPNL